VPTETDRSIPKQVGVPRVTFALATAAVVLPYALLVLLSLGSGWTFPHLLPDRLDFAPWKRLLADRDGMLRAVARSTLMSLAVASLSTTGGLLIARSVRTKRSGVCLFLMYVPFVVSPLIIGVCLYDLLIRLRLAGTVLGVILAQAMIAMSFAAVFFSETWSEKTDRLEMLVRQLGGRFPDVWRHAVLIPMFPLIMICFLQTAIYSWVDYGLVFILGGGQVSTVTMQVFAYIREASINQAAASGLVLLAPPLAGIFITAALLRRLVSPAWQSTGGP
jgi:putative spermidine/putrescine transport system permease protein